MKRLWIPFLTLVLFAAADTALAKGIPATQSGQTKTIQGIDRRLEGTVTLVGDEATRIGDQSFAERVADRFDVTADVLLQEKTRFNAQWGDLLISHSIVDLSKTTVTLDQIFQMRTDGLTWTQIARTLRIPPGKLLQALRKGTEDLTETATHKPAAKEHGAAAKKITGGAKVHGSATTKVVGGGKIHGPSATMKVGAGAAAKVRK